MDDRSPEGHLRPTAAQNWMLQNVAWRVQAYGECLPDLIEESSLAEILDSRDHYGMEPKNLAGFDFDKVKILHGEVHVRPIRRELPPAALGYLRHAADLIEMDEAELEKDRAEGTGISPYWDPNLALARPTEASVPAPESSGPFDLAPAAEGARGHLRG